MKPLSVFLTIAALPLIVRADSIESSNVSNVNSGGITAAAGQSVESSSSDASVSIKTIIDSNDSGGTADVQIVTAHDGIARQETKHYAIPAGGTLQLDIATTSGSAHSSTLIARAAIGIHSSRAHATSSPSVSAEISASTRKSTVAPSNTVGLLLFSSNLMSRLLQNLSHIFSF